MAVNTEEINRMLSELAIDMGREEQLRFNNGIIEPCDHQCGFLDVIDMSNMPDSNYNYIFYFRDEATKYTFCRPLLADNPYDIATELLNCFIQISYYQRCPDVLHTRRSLHFTQSIVDAMEELYPEYTIYVGRYDENDDMVKRQYLNRTRKVKKDLLERMKSKNTPQWSFEIYLVMQNINGAYDPELGESPETMMEGANPRRRG